MRNAYLQSETVTVKNSILFAGKWCIITITSHWVFAENNFLYKSYRKLLIKISHHMVWNGVISLLKRETSVIKIVWFMVKHFIFFNMLVKCFGFVLVVLSYATQKGSDRHHNCKAEVWSIVALLVLDWSNLAVLWVT